MADHHQGPASVSRGRPQNGRLEGTGDFAFAAVILGLTVPLIAFALLALEATTLQTHPLDRSIMLWVRQQSINWPPAAVEVLSGLGGLISVPVFALGLAIVLSWRGSRSDAAFVLATVAGALLLNVVLKEAFRRSRPELWAHTATEYSYSFPSGHSMATMALTASLIVVAWRTRWRWIALMIGTSYVLVVGSSRVVLGVHYPSDILAGWCASVWWVVLVIVAFRYLSDPRRPDAGGSHLDPG